MTKSTVAHNTPSKKQSSTMRSFRVYEDEKPFVALRANRQTLYWIILLVVILVTQLWILKIKLDIASLTYQLTN